MTGRWTFLGKLRNRVLGLTRAKSSSEPPRDAMRRETVRRAHILRDYEEDYESRLNQTTDQSARQVLMDDLHRFRMAHREEDIRRGVRPAVEEGARGVVMRQNMWARWMEVAHAHCVDAQLAAQRLKPGDTATLLEELRPQW